MNFYIDNLSSALGETAQSVEDAERAGLTRSTAKVMRQAGFERHHISGKGSTAYDLARSAVESIRPSLRDIGAIIYATCLPQNSNIGSEAAFRATRDVKHLMEFPASHLQADFGLNDAWVVGLTQQACTGVLGSIRLASTLLMSDPELATVLCVTSDRFPEGALYEQAYNLISDGAVACTVSTAPGRFRLLGAHGLTNGAMAQASDDETVGSYFTYTHRVIRETLVKTRLRMDDIDWVVPQNTNTKAWQILSRLLNYDPCKVYSPTLPQVGHMISGDNIVNMQSLTASGQLAAGDKLLLFMAGYGLNWQCVILEYCGEGGAGCDAATGEKPWGED